MICRLFLSEKVPQNSGVSRNCDGDRRRPDIPQHRVTSPVPPLGTCMAHDASPNTTSVLSLQGLQKRLTAMELEAFHKGRVEQINPDLPIDEQAELLPYAHDEWEFPKDRLILGQ